MLKHNKLSISLAIVILLLIPAASVFAYFATINTDDGLIDLGWPASPLVSDSSSDAPAGFEIVSYWLVTDASTPSNLFFRADLAGTIDTEGVLIAELDCDSDSSNDYLISYYPPGTVYDDLVIVENVAMVEYDQYFSTTLGEQIGASVYEWQAPVSGANVDLGSCLASTFSTRLGTYYDDGVSGFLEQDITTYIQLNTPTIVTLADFGAQQSSVHILVVSAMAAIALVGLGLMAALWRKGWRA